MNGHNTSLRATVKVDRVTSDSTAYQITAYNEEGVTGKDSYWDMRFEQ